MIIVGQISVSYRSNIGQISAKHRSNIGQVAAGPGPRMPFEPRSNIGQVAAGPGPRMPLEPKAGYGYIYIYIYVYIYVCMFFFLRKQRNAEPPAKTHMAITLTIFLGGTLVGSIMLRAWLPCLLAVPPWCGDHGAVVMVLDHHGEEPWCRKSTLSGLVQIWSVMVPASTLSGFSVEDGVGQWGVMVQLLH
jgi:hypothetical protein